MLRSHEKIELPYEYEKEKTETKAGFKKKQAEISVLENDTHSVYQITIQMKQNQKFKKIRREIKIKKENTINKPDQVIQIGFT